MKLSFNGLAQVATSALLLTSADARTTLSSITEAQTPSSKISGGRKLMQDASAYNDPIANDQWYMKDVSGSDAHRRGDSGASIYKAHTITKGEGATVALIGNGWGEVAGVHADLDGAILPVPNEINAPEENPYADGIIHTAGLIAARDNNGIGLVGTAPEAKLLPLRGQYLDDVENSIRWSAGLDVNNVPTNENVADVIQINSEFFYPDGCPESLQGAINDAVAAGSVIVSPAGGTNRPIDTAPTNCDNVIVVGASNVSGEESTSLTNYGDQVDLLASGGQIAPNEKLPNMLTGVPAAPIAGSTVLPVKFSIPELTNKINLRSTWYNDSYEYARGTSASAALVSGVIALMRSVSNINHAQAESILKSTAAPLNAPCGHGENQCGAGRLDAFEAVNLAKNTEGNAKSPAQSLSEKAANALIAAACIALAIT